MTGHPLSAVTPLSDFIESALDTSPAAAGLFNKAVRHIESRTGRKLYIEGHDPFGLDDPDMGQARRVLGSLIKKEYCKRLTKMGRFSDLPHMYYVTTGAGGSGADFFSIQKAAWRAIGETLERTMWRRPAQQFPGYRVAPWSALGDRALDLHSIAGFSDEQRVQPRLAFTRDTEFAWIEGYSHTRKKTLWVPAQLVSSPHSLQGTSHAASGSEPVLRPSITTGLATGGFLNEALYRGMLEVIERDAFMITYLNRLSPPRLNLEALAAWDEEIATILARFARYHLVPHLVVLPTDFPVYVVQGIITDPTGVGPSVAVGAKASFDLKEAVVAALSESLSVYNWARIQGDKKVEWPYIGHDRVVWWAQRKDISPLNFYFAGKEVGPGDITLPKEVEGYVTAEDRVNLLLYICMQKGYEVVSVDMLYPDHAAWHGLHSRFVIIPQLQPLHLDERFVHKGGARLREVPQQLGYTPANSLNSEPHPFP